MSLLDRLTNPIWHKVSKLDRPRQCTAACIICGYGAIRHYVKEELVFPLQSFLREHDIITKTGEPELTPGLITELTDEATVGLLRCCSVPSADPSGNLPPAILAGLPELWGIFILADMNHRLGRSSPNLLEETDYSKDPDEARTQVLVNWMRILGVKRPSLVTGLGLRVFGREWRRLVELSLSGMLTGFSRVPEEILLSKARRGSAEIPQHRISLALKSLTELH